MEDKKTESKSSVADRNTGSKSSVADKNARSSMADKNIGSKTSGKNDYLSLGIQPYMFVPAPVSKPPDVRQIGLSHWNLS